MTKRKKEDAENPIKSRLVKNHIEMSKTILTPQVLRDKGFEEKLMFGHICFVKDKYAVVYSFAWIPCTLENGQPLSTDVYVNTWEGLEALMK